MTVTTANQGTPAGRGPYQGPYQGVAPRPAPPKPKTSTLTRLRRTRVVLTVAALAVGAVGALTVQARADGAHDALKHSGPLTRYATTLYHKLSDADATAATLYLHTGPAPADLLARYQQDMSDASDALTALTAEADGAPDSAGDIKKISQALPQYAQDMGYARSISNYGFPLGTRYLIAASNLMQGDPSTKDPGILGAAKNLVDTESRNLVDAQDTASAVPVAEVLAVLLMLVLLLFVQVGERGRTRRLLNAGLVAATAALVLSAVWLGAAFGIQDDEVSMAKKNGSDQLLVLAKAQVQSLQGRTDEMLTLVGRGTANDRQVDFQTVARPGLEQYLAQAKKLATDATAALAAGRADAHALAWGTAHDKLRDLDNDNNYPAAVASALGEPAADGSKDDGSAGAQFGLLQADLDAAITHAQDGLQKHSQSALDAVSGAAVGMAVLGLAMAAGVVVGLGRRISEYQ